MYRVQRNVPLSKSGRKDTARKNPRNFWKYENFPIEKLTDVGYSFIASEHYDYGKTISIKNACRKQAQQLFEQRVIPSIYRFAVREWRGKTRVWRTE